MTKIYVICYVESAGDYRESYFEIKDFSLDDRKASEEYIKTQLNNKHYWEEGKTLMEITVVIGDKVPFVKTEKVIEKVEIRR